jgi:hypothetical protein
MLLLFHDEQGYTLKKMQLAWFDENDYFRVPAMLLYNNMRKKIRTEYEAGDL